jgi:hypothetical protein
MKRLVAIAIVAVFVTGCATQGDQARTEGTLIGAGLGAAIGAGLGYAIGGSGTSAGIGAAIGALAGGAGGYVYADRIAKRHDELVGKEDDLNARIAFARGVNEDTQEYNARLKKEVGELQPRIAELAAKKEKQEITQRELQREKQTLDTRIKEANKQLAAGEQELRELKQFRSEQKKTPKSGELDKEIKILEQNLAQVKSNTSALASLNQRI